MRPTRLLTCAAVIAGITLPWPVRAGDAPSGLAGYERPFSAAERSHWAFQPPVRPAVPSVAHSDGCRTPIDAFVLAKLEAAGLAPAPPADRSTLLRRVYLDLIGLPPTPDEQRAFLADDSPHAFEKVVDDLLARPQYGERWARHWLDVARYAESNGYERDGAKPSAWRYRDYVVRSFNDDKPYDRFLVEQLAGDEVDGSNAESQIGTTFLRLGTWDDEPAEPMLDRYEQLDDVLGTTASAFLGLTLRCARCHYHKFEPLSQVDYYRMLAVFQPLKRPQEERTDLDRMVGTDSELAAYRRALAKTEAELKPLDEALAQITTAVRDRLFAAAASDPAATGAPARDAARTANAKRTALPTEAIAAFRAEPSARSAEQKQLVKKFSDQLDREIREAQTADETNRRAELEKQVAEFRARRPPEPPHGYIWYEEGQAAPAMQVLRRGDPTAPVAEVGPGLPAILARHDVPPPVPTSHSTGRRLWLARWMTRRDNPLVPRVWVNRIWQHHFGEGLVASENDFGVMGDSPSHPELLDWLACELVAGGWRTKPIHRMIVLSSTYQQAAAYGAVSPGLRPGSDESVRQGAATRADASNDTLRATDPGPPPADPGQRPGLNAAAASDPENRLLWHWRTRRLEAEAVRDAVLAVSGRLNPEMGGSSVFPPLPRAVLEGQSRPGDGWGKSDEREAARRSIYVFIKRVLAVPELELLDAPDTTSSCEQRTSSTIAPQALTFLNGEFMQQQAGHLAERLRRDAGDDPATQVARAFALALARPPRPEESQTAIDFLARQCHQIEADARAAGKLPGDTQLAALRAFCLVLLNTNEFVYVD